MPGTTLAECLLLLARPVAPVLVLGACGISGSLASPCLLPTSSLHPAGVILAAITFITASLIPMLSSTKREAFGPFRPEAELLNGRAAMIGFAALLVVEGVRGSALF